MPDSDDLRKRVYLYIGRNPKFHLSWLLEDVLSDEEKKDFEVAKKGVVEVMRQLVNKGILTSTSSTEGVTRKVEGRRPITFFETPSKLPREFREELEKFQKSDEEIVPEAILKT